METYSVDFLTPSFVKDRIKHHHHYHQELCRKAISAEGEESLISNEKKISKFII
jgi:hypothetical protein